MPFKLASMQLSRRKQRQTIRFRWTQLARRGKKKCEPVHVILIEPPATRIRSSARATRLPIIDTGSIVLAIERTEVALMMVFQCVQRLVGATEPVHIQIIPILLRIHAECAVLNAQAAIVPRFEPNLQLHVIVVGERVQKVVAIPKFTVQVAESIFVVGPRPIKVLRHTCRIPKATRLNYRPRQTLRVERTHAIVEWAAARCSPMRHRLKAEYAIAVADVYEVMATVFGWFAITCDNANAVGRAAEVPPHSND